MEQRDVAILRHIGLYRITVRPVLERLFFPDTEPGSVLQRLRESRLIVAKKLKRTISYYQLTPAGANATGIRNTRADPLGPSALHHHLAILWFCTMDGTERYRVEHENLTEHGIPRPPRTGEHCVEIGPQGRSRILQVYVPDCSTDPDRVRRRLKEATQKALADSTLRGLIKARQYGFAVLVDLESRRQSTRELVERTRLRGKPLSAHAHFQVNLAPAPATVEQYFAAARSTHTDGR